MASSIKTPETGTSTPSVFTSSRGEAEIDRAYRAIVDTWPVGHQELFIPTSFGETHVLASGPTDAPPVVFLHALFATATSWYRNVEAFSDHYRTYCVDVIGEANMSRPTRPIVSLDGFLEWFVELLDGLGIQQVALVGNSYGGFTGAYYAMMLPERVTKLVLVGPASTIAPITPFMVHMFYPKALYMLLPGAPGLSRVMRRSVDWLHAGLSADPLWEPLFYRTMMYGKLINRVFPRVYTDEEFARIKASVLLVLGDREVIYNDLQKTVTAARELVEGIEVEVIPGAHHITALAQPELTNRRILDFLLKQPA
jgi:pimeloyl-ACP methyl ester carboxylesterase